MALTKAHNRMITGSPVNVLDFGAIGDGTTDDAAAIQLALTAGGTVYIPDGSYILGSQLVIKSNTNLILGKNAIMLRAWAGTSGQRPDNATIKNENAPLAATINVDPGPLVPSVWDTNIHIIGGQWGHKDNDPATYKGTHVALMALRYGSFKSSQFNTQRAEWCTCFWVENFSVDDLQFNVAEGNADVSNDALHIVGGRNITVSNIRGGCDDDFIAIGYNYNLPIDGVVVNNIACQTNSNAVKVYQIRAGITSGYGAPTQEVKNVTVTNVSGRVAAVRTGLFDVLIDGHTQYNLVKNITFSGVDVAYAGTHDEANTIGIDVAGGNNIYFDNISIIGSPVRSMFSGANCTNLRIHNFNPAQPSKASAEAIELDTCDNVSIIGGKLTPTSNATGANSIKCTDVTNISVDNAFMTEIQDGYAGLIFLNTCTGKMTNCTVQKKVGETTAKGFSIASGATVASLVISGNDFSDTNVPIDVAPTPTAYIAVGNLGADASGATSVANGGTIAHGLLGNPTKFMVTPSVSGEMVSVTAHSSTTLTVAIIKNDGTAGTTQTIYWQASLV